MTREENYFKAIRFDYPEWIPISVRIMPATWAKYRVALEEIVLQHPVIFGEYERGDIDFDKFEGTYQEGEHIDAWGCVWKNVAPGLDGVVVKSPLTRREDVHTLQPPTEHTGLPHGFMFMRLYYLRGFEELMIDFAEEPLELQILIDKILAYNLNEIDLILGENPKMVVLGDDLGNQDFLPIHPQKWLKYLKPCYEKLFARCHQKGALVYFHSDGHILEIIPALIESGVNVLNPQVGANGIDHLAQIAKGKVAIDLDLDRQHFPFWTRVQIEEHIHEAVEKLSSAQGGLLLVAEVAPDVPLKTIAAICELLEKYKSYI